MKRTFLQTTAKPRFLPLDTLPNDNINTFRDQFFHPQLPIVLPRNHFRYLPALNRWFVVPAANNHFPSPAKLNYSYLEKYGDFHVPLELTQPSSHNNPDEENPVFHSNSFKRFNAPLSLFLEWTR